MGANCDCRHMADLSKMQPVRRENLPEIVFERMCQLILEGGIEPGQAVTVASLSDVLDVSPMPIREAMARLAHIGALTRLTGRSMGVPNPSLEELIHLRDTRITVEEAAVRMAVENREPQFEARLRDLLSEMIEAEHSHDNLRFINLNYRFHFLIYEQSKNPVLIEIIRNLWLRISPNFHILNVRGHLKVSNELHRKIIEAIAGNDAATACTSLQLDIERAHDQLIACLGLEATKGLVDAGN